jgi:tRNA pseudouridine38-40 synthase
MTEAPQRTQNWKLTVAYDGTDYAGWQVQPDLPTVQGELAIAIFRVVGERVLPQGAGRTDAGVHADGQVASFSIRASIPPDNLLRALNRVLPQAIRILQAEPASENFHARHCACAKTYIYTLYCAEICHPKFARYVYPVSFSLSLEAMQQAAVLVEGEHDFASFAASSPDLAARTDEGASDPISVRRVFSSSWAVLDEDRLQYRIRGNAFLHHMVRNLVGTFIEIGRGRLRPDDVPAILAKQDRSAAGPTAPAQGLSLQHVEYASYDGETAAK